tara:strand:- start:2025 stop:2297 length:273 start_codon:yes stop_codon:yes gene_type:complete
MGKTKYKFKALKYFMFLLVGMLLGVGAIWPGIIRETGRKCFFKTIQDGSDGRVSLETIFSISPNYLLKINNEKNKYNKILLIGDFCFRKL